MADARNIAATPKRHGRGVNHKPGTQSECDHQSSRSTMNRRLCQYKNVVRSGHKREQDGCGNERDG